MLLTFFEKKIKLFITTRKLITIPGNAHQKDWMKIMMYMHYCKLCHRIFMLNGHKMICPKCTEPLTELQISYLDYTDLDPAQRQLFKEACADDEKLHQLKATYRMYKYSKWYKELQSKNTDDLPITSLLAANAKRSPDDHDPKTVSSIS